ncbi:MAG: acetylxylan esterase, partial [Planctomycetota bacterium]
VLVPPEWNHEVVIWIDPAGKQALFDDAGKPKPAVQKVLAAGRGVVGVDLFGQGEFTADGKPLVKARLAESGRGAWASYAGYTFGYNHPVFSKRVHDILSLVALARSVESIEKVHLVGLNGAGHWVAAARAQAGDAIDRAVVDTGGFRFRNLTAFDDPDFLPGGAKHLDLPGMLALSAPGQLWLGGEGPEAPKVVAAAYKAAKSPGRVTVCGAELSQREAAALAWLLR